MSHSVVYLSKEEDFHAFLKENEAVLVVIDFFATWCGPCKNIAPKIEELSTSMTNVKFAKVDVDDSAMGKIVENYGITSLPTFVLIKDKKIVEQFPGANIEKLKEAIFKAL
uniref:Thioredoxin n=1 Tax=Cuerna arida TaxID=1464854 RepID=A0A1B6H266_9HEMI